MAIEILADKAFALGAQSHNNFQNIKDDFGCDLEHARERNGTTVVGGVGLSLMCSPNGFWTQRSLKELKKKRISRENFPQPEHKLPLVGIALCTPAAT